MSQIFIQKIKELFVVVQTEIVDWVLVLHIYIIYAVLGPWDTAVTVSLDIKCDGFKVNVIWSLIPVSHFLCDDSPAHMNLTTLLFF